jgi:hypothetical protein
MLMCASSGASGMEAMDNGESTLLVICRDHLHAVSFPVMIARQVSTGMPFVLDYRDISWTPMLA